MSGKHEKVQMPESKLKINRDSGTTVESANPCTHATHDGEIISFGFFRRRRSVVLQHFFFVFVELHSQSFSSKRGSGVCAEDHNREVYSSVTCHVR